MTVYVLLMEQVKYLRLTYQLQLRLLLPLNLFAVTGVIPAVAAGSQIGIITNRQNEVNGERKSAYRAPNQISIHYKSFLRLLQLVAWQKRLRKWHNRYDGGEDAKAFMKNVINATYEHYKAISYAMWFEQIN